MEEKAKILQFLKVNPKEEIFSKTRQEILNIFGEPDDIGVTSRKYPVPSVFKYGDIEIHFGPRARDMAWMVFDSKTHKPLAKPAGDRAGNAHFPKRKR